MTRLGADGFVSWTVRVPTPEIGEIAAAEAFAAGASGLEEQEGGRTLQIFADEARADAVARALSGLAPMGVEPGVPEPVEDTDWSTAWREGLAAVRIGDALIVRPPFVESPDPALPCVVIEPAQAFGTGGHASTRLAAELLVRVDWRGRSVLDIGTGSGVLALAALRLGAERAVGFDLDPLAGPAAAANGRDNGLAQRLRLFTGPLDALAADTRFDLVVANMIRTEQEPILEALLARTKPDGSVLLSGLLEAEDERMTRLLGRHGFAVVTRLRECDERDDAWLALEARRS